VLGATRNAAAGAHGPVDQRLVRGGRAQHHLRVVYRPPFVDAVWKRRRLRRGEGGELDLVSVAYDIWGVEENIPRPFGPRKRRARSRREYRNAESHERFEFDARPRPRYGANTGAGTIVSTPGTLRRLGARCGKWDKWRKNRTQHPFAREQKVVRRGRAGNARLHRPHGPYTRLTDPVDKIRRRAREIRDRTRWTRANIDVACRARLPGFQGENRGECGGGLAGERA
jgi:hypothetical protein